MPKTEEKLNINQKLMVIQGTLKAPKGQYNSFGKYNYRNCEDILEALKPILTDMNAVVTLTDEPVQIGDRYYIKATAIITNTENGECIFTTAYAREDETKKGMDLAQVTGSTSSYARKYALNGLFAIDDTKDSDTTNKQDDTPPQRPQAAPSQGANNKANDAQIKKLFATAKGKGVPDTELKQKLADMGKTSSKELTVSECSKLIDWVNEWQEAV